MHKAAIKYIEEHPEIAIINADKGNKTVILTKDMYKVKANEHLSDSNIYHEMSNGHKMTRHIEIKNNKLIKDLLSENMINEFEAKRLTSEGGNPPRIYFTIKTHKSSLPVRPVVSTPGTPIMN